MSRSHFSSSYSNQEKFQSTDPRDKVFALLAHPSAYTEMPTGRFKNYASAVPPRRKNTESDNLMPGKLIEAWAGLMGDEVDLVNEMVPGFGELDTKDKVSNRFVEEVEDGPSEPRAVKSKLERIISDHEADFKALVEEPSEEEL